MQSTRGAKSIRARFYAQHGIDGCPRSNSAFATDEKQTEKKTVLLLNIGGFDQSSSHGSHWHADPRHQIRYRSDKKRQHIYEVELTQLDRTVKVFKSTAAPPADLEQGWRRMDCVDCHNRPTHIYRMPNDELDSALESKQLDRSLPFIKREGLRAIELKFASHADARNGIQKALFGFYEKSYPDLAKSDPTRIEGAADVLWNIYRQNVFPQMNIAWGTYPAFVDHGGCFRCHDKEHQTQTGENLEKLRALSSIARNRRRKPRDSASTPPVSLRKRRAATAGVLAC